MATNYGTIKSNGSNIKILSSEIYHTGGGKTLDSILFPVGSVYITVVNTNPSTWFGGTWSLLCPGRTLVCVDTSDSDFKTVKKTGGSKYLQAHTHAKTMTFRRQADGVYGFVDALHYSGEPYSESRTVDSGNVNGTQTGNSGNLQPYMTVYIWQRTA